ncbi:alpha/beta fold hydrolase [Rhodococcus sp. IEGM 1381]|uniref:thioesterase II family protein n=1 Tax=Rhodococcus sp. IEGM 1381 TaxID=3047085 RepID=UPI0024B760D7|nr:alpha/beta fold hydrolase [Rhodococcus sp. IEGM 1381]MDI9894473.1 alpha/beta fold hydrolase [Rhodococcus sp. IEGM 1381]
MNASSRPVGKTTGRVPATQGAERGRWLRTQRSVTAPAFQLICFPPAGATAQSFRGWPALLPEDISLQSVQYPGRQDRLGEPCADSMQDVVGPIADEIEPILGRRTAFFGHSMGASVAYEVCVELERRGRGPDVLVVSGATAPQDRKAIDGIDLCDDRSLIDDVVRLNPHFDELRQMPELVDLVLPSIRADYSLIGAYHRPEPPTVLAKVSAFGGAADPDVSETDLARWAVVAPDGLRDVTQFGGGHFYLDEDPRAVVTALSERLI